jgi:hypothetical protein
MSALPGNPLHAAQRGLTAATKIPPPPPCGRGLERRERGTAQRITASSRPVHCDANEAAMRKFVAKHAAATTGTLSCFDRLLFKGHLSLGYPHGMEDFLNHQGALFKQLKPFVLRQAERLWTHSHAVAEQAGRPWQYFESPVRKDQRAREIATRDGISEGLVCVFATVEPCRSFRLATPRGDRPSAPRGGSASSCTSSSSTGTSACSTSASRPGSRLPSRPTSTATSGSLASWTSGGPLPSPRQCLPLAR